VAIKRINANHPHGNLHKRAKGQEEESPPDSNQRQAWDDEPDSAEYPGIPWSVLFHNPGRYWNGVFMV
jgi:hypothetical protein